MRFKLDENLPEADSEWLAAAGRDVHTVVDERQVRIRDAGT